VEKFRGFGFLGLLSSFVAGFLVALGFLAGLEEATDDEAEERFFDDDDVLLAGISCLLLWFKEAPGRMIVYGLIGERTVVPEWPLVA
jgi:hypothetical protein